MAPVAAAYSRAFTSSASRASKAGELHEASERTPKLCPVAISPSSTMDQINHAQLRALPRGDAFTLDRAS